jgi:hypothetical protein
LERGKPLLKVLLPLRLLQVFRRDFVPESILRVLTQACKSGEHLSPVKLLSVALGNAE